MSKKNQSKRDFILSDKEIVDLRDFTPFPEGDPIYFYDDDDETPILGFWGVAEEVARATAAEAAMLETGQARALLMMRSFYFLGVLRGAEEYRSYITADEHLEDNGLEAIPFELAEGAAEDFREELDKMPPKLFKRLCAMLGLSVEWDGKRGSLGKG